MNEPKEKRKYYKWKKEDLKKALEVLTLKEMGLNECSRRFGIPEPTLRRHLLKKIKHSNDADVNKGRPTTFSEEVETLLAQHLLNLENSLFG